MKQNFFTYCLLLAALLVAACHHKSALFIQLTEAQTGIRFCNQITDSDSLNILTYPYLFNGAGVAIADINNDRKEDIFWVGNQKGSNQLYLNRGNFTFDNITATAGVGGKSDWCTGISTVDINGDGWLDFYISTVSIAGLLHSTNELYINNGNNTFTEAAHQ